MKFRRTVLRGAFALLVGVGGVGCARPPAVAPSAVPPPIARAARTEEQTALRRRAADLTKRGTELRLFAAETPDATAAQSLLDRALVAYREATTAWAAALASEPTATNDARFWLGDAWDKVVRLTWALHLSFPTERARPSPADLEQALATTKAARDALVRFDFQTLSAAYVVELADIGRDIAYADYEESGGTKGAARRTELVTHGEGASSTFEVVDVPAPVLESIRARIAYAEVRNDAAVFGKRMTGTFVYEAATAYYVRGHLDEARDVLERIDPHTCRSGRFDQRAWELLLAIAVKQKDQAASRRVAELSQTDMCVFTKDGDEPGGPIIDEVRFWDEDHLFIEACGRDLKKSVDRCDPVTVDKLPLWKKTAAAYAAVLDGEPHSGDAPTAAFRAAFAYVQAGEPANAVATFRRFITYYRDEEVLARLDYGILANPNDNRRYRERLEFLLQGYDQASFDALAGFDVGVAATLEENAAAEPRFDAKLRHERALTALQLFAAMGAKPELEASLARFRALHPPPQKLARAELLQAELDLERALSGDATAAKAARSALEAYYRTHRADPAAAPFVFEAAWALSRLAQVTRDPSYGTWLESASAARASWSRNLTEDERAAYDAMAPTFAKLERELHPTRVDATTSLSTVFVPTPRPSP